MTLAKDVERSLVVYRASERRRLWAVLLVGLALTFSVLVDVAIGPSLLPFRSVVAALLRSASADVVQLAIVWDIRLPMALMAVVVGIALGTSGATMQTLLDNPLASPYTLGLAAAAGFGASLAIQTGGLGLNPLFAVPLTAFVFASISALVVYRLGSLSGLTGDTMILAGIALTFLFHSLQSLVQFRATPEVSQQITFWLFGSLAKANWMNLSVTTIVCIAALPILVRSAWQLTTFRLGELRARALGVPVDRLRFVAITLVSLMTATAVSFVGTIGFVGLVAPHVARLLVGDDQRYLLPLAGLLGGLLLSLASVVAKVIMPGVVVPIGLVTAVVGVPFFLHLIVWRARHARS